MSYRPTNRWTRNRSRVILDSEEIAMRHSLGRLPVPLAQIAKERGVNQIVLQPLIIDGALAINPAGLRMYIRCDEAEARCLDLTEPQTERDSCADLSGRTRFTIAHEIAHTFFIDLDTFTPNADLDLKNVRTVESLEATCDLAASRILLPEAILRHEERDGDFLDPDCLRRLASQARISSPSLVYRIGQARRTSQPYGILCSISRLAEGPVIQAVTRHVGFRDVFPELVERALLTEILSDEDFVLNGGKRYEITKCYGRDRAKADRWFMFAAERALGPDWNTCFLTVSHAQAPS